MHAIHYIGFIQENSLRAIVQYYGVFAEATELEIPQKKLVNSPTPSLKSSGRGPLPLRPSASGPRRVP